LEAVTANFEVISQ